MAIDTVVTNIPTCAELSGVGPKCLMPQPVEPPPPAGPLLSITKTHIGNFQVGLNGTYTITVCNVGAGPTTGLVTVTDTLPAGFAVVSLSGTGWSPVGATATRSDVLAPGACYPPITLIVSVS